MHFQPMMDALSSPLANTFNNGFYRKDAFFAVIFITDTAEQSRYISSQQMYDFLVQLKGDAKKVLSYAVIKTTWDLKNCPAEDDDPPTTKLENFLSMTVNAVNHSNVLSLCSTDYGSKLAEFSKDIATRSSGLVYLQRLPVVSTIKVTYGTQVIKNSVDDGWTYDPAQNAIRFSENVVWDPTQVNAEVGIEFQTFKP
jgi:hypothetical protein